jgi:hypothetical protein
MSKFNETVSALRKADETKTFNNLKIINVNITAKTEYTLVTLTLDNDVPAYVKDKDTDEFVLKSTNVIFVSLYSLNAVLRNNDDSVSIVNYLQNHSNALASILIGSKVEIIQQSISGQTIDDDGNPVASKYHDYWKNEEVERSEDYDTIFNHIVNIEFTKKSLAKIEKIEDKLLFEDDDDIE